MEVTGANATSCMKTRVYTVLSNVTYSPSHRQTVAPVVNAQSTLRTATDLRKNVSLAVLFGSDGNSCSLHTVRYVYILYTHILHNIETLVGHKK